MFKRDFFLFVTLICYFDKTMYKIWSTYGYIISEGNTTDNRRQGISLASEKRSICFHSTDIPTVNLLLILYFEFLMFLQEGKNLGLHKFNFHTDYNKKNNLDIYSNNSTKFMCSYGPTQNVFICMWHMKNNFLFHVSIRKQNQWNKKQESVCYHLFCGISTKKLMEQIIYMLFFFNLICGFENCYKCLLRWKLHSSNWFPHEV